MYTVTRLAREAGSTTDAVRHYTELGLLRPQRDRANNYRQYSATDLKRLCFIRTSRELGFSLDDIRRILADADRGDAPCPQVRELYAQRLPDCVPTGASLCHLIDQAAVCAGEDCRHD